MMLQLSFLTSHGDAREARSNETSQLFRSSWEVRERKIQLVTLLNLVTKSDYDLCEDEVRFDYSNMYFLSVGLSICLSVLCQLDGLFVCPSVCLSSVGLSVCLSFCLSVAVRARPALSVWLSTCPSVPFLRCLFVCRSILMSILLFCCLFDFSSVCLSGSVFLTANLSVPPFPSMSFVCRSILMSILLFCCLFDFSSVCLSVCLSICLALSFWLPICPSLPSLRCRLSVGPSLCVYLSVLLSIWRLFDCSSVCLPVCQLGCLLAYLHSQI